MDNLAAAGGFAFLASAAATMLLLPVLRRLKARQTVRSDGPRSHMVKTGTPTMGGAAILLGVTAAAFIYGRSSPVLAVLLLGTLGFGLVGFADDFIKVVLKRPLGLRAREKLLAQGLIGALVHYILVLQGQSTVLTVPFTSVSMELGTLYLPFVILVLIATTNGVNLADGLDGLAAGTAAIAALAFLFVAMASRIPDAALFAVALAGAAGGFLIFNLHPARVFMGDTGSLALGAALAMLALVTKSELLLPLIGGIYVVEAASVMIQVVYFRITRGKRIFRMSPLHHHFELAGFAETSVVYGFWLVSLGFALLGIAGYGVSGRVGP